MFESLTLDNEQVAYTADVLRKKVFELSEDDRRSFYRLTKNRIKDADTYAILNWFFIMGLHHFYLRQWIRGVINLFLLFVGVCFIPFYGIGLIVIFGVALSELPACFRSKVIVDNHNNKVQESILQTLSH